MSKKENIWIHRPPKDKEKQKNLKNRGVSPIAFSTESFSYKEHVKQIKKEYNNHVKTFSRRDQLLQFKDTIDEPFDYKYTFFIGSDYNSQKSRAAALDIFISALKKFVVGKNKGFPYWHYVLGGFRDKIRDEIEPVWSKAKDSSLLVLDGIDESSTEPKLEKARDLIETIDSPIIVVCTGNPLEMAHDKIHVPVNRCFYMGKTKDISI